MPRSLNPHLAELPATEGIIPWQCAVCGEILKLPVGGPLIANATALGIFSEAHRHKDSSPCSAPDSSPAKPASSAPLA